VEATLQGYKTLHIKYVLIDSNLWKIGFDDERSEKLPKPNVSPTWLRYPYSYRTVD